MSAPVTCLWPGQTFILIGGGPSLTAPDVRAVRGQGRVIAINDAYRLAAWADVLYGCDAHWWDWHRNVPTFTGLRFALEPQPIRPDVHVLKNTGPTGLERDPTGLRSGRNSGYQAINLAVHLGAARILLLGFDVSPDPTTGRTHWFGRHPEEPKPSPYEEMRGCFETLVNPLLAAGVTVWNCSRRTALTAFPCLSLDEALSAVAA